MSDTYHVYPTNDLKEHETDGESCHCGPRIQEVNGGKIVTHRSYDHREFIEEAEAIKANPDAYL